MATVTLKFQNTLNCYIWFTSTSYQRWLNPLKTQAIFIILAVSVIKHIQRILTKLHAKRAIICTFTVTYGTVKKNKRSSVLNLPKQRQVCPSLFFQFNMRISVIYGTLCVSYKRVVSVLSPYASNSCGGSRMITNVPAPDHLDELLGHFSFFFKDQPKNDGSDLASDTMTSFRTTSASHWRANTYTIFLVMTEKTFWTWCICILILLSTESLCNVQERMI